MPSCVIAMSEEKLQQLRAFVESKAKANDFTGLTALEKGFMEGFIRRQRSLEEVK